ncbi:acetyl-CoA carboxylase biotin carboxylase subunit [uncultured Thermanaerothrix sp.]|uniref:acetyl-CoA carboxylase biotin carboxylase subunit n=1 Tax=uncultured Thermanaerothrix sp. TaxID=1195149 RepID=UPI002626935B|nr:acetyl-CoA carboxylase biotin carboxylase subunit [uncultured Thermanaerothrix sp.]
MFKKILIANRGEIAVRIARACRELGIQSVAVYSDADRQALHVRYADEAYYLGPSPARESYLCADKILAIARKCGADAIHPGYGFLAERADFAQACMESGITFIGPKPSAIAAMGDKAVARATVAVAGVPVVPGTEGEGNLSDEELLTIAPQIGFPLLIKATAGGGGKGMREVRSIEEMPALLQAARREAEAAFGDGNIYLEKLIPGARHIEFQILADSYGNIVHLGERECSIQRRHQKLVEESPSPLLAENPDLRARMGEVAIRAAKAVGYVNAGTIEFLVDQEHNFYFLEMNTRLQVEHPVTEMVTGTDLVKEQILIAAGCPLRFTQEDVHLRGAAIECRINAEDPAHNFIPTIGQIRHLFTPAGPGVRLDSGIYAGYEISPYYDPLIAKLIVWGETRTEAIQRMRRALEELRIVGVQTNVPFHLALMHAPRFIAGQYDTSFVDQHLVTAQNSDEQTVAMLAAIAAALAAHRQRPQKVTASSQPAYPSNAWKWVGRWEFALR